MTAQPLESVRLASLTDDPDQFLTDHDFRVTHRDAEVEFDIP